MWIFAPCLRIVRAAAGRFAAPLALHPATAPTFRNYVADVDGGEIIKERAAIHIKGAIVLVVVPKGLSVARVLLPAIPAVAPFTCPLALTPWIAQLHKRHLLNLVGYSKKAVGMILQQTLTCFILDACIVAHNSTAHKHDMPTAAHIHQHFPQSPFLGLFEHSRVVQVYLVRCSSRDISQSIVDLTSVQCFIATMQLCVCLLNDHHPDFVWVFAACKDRLSVRSTWNAIVYDDVFPFSIFEEANHIHAVLFVLGRDKQLGKQLLMSSHN